MTSLQFKHIFMTAEWKIVAKKIIDTSCNFLFFSLFDIVCYNLVFKALLLQNAYICHFWHLYFFVQIATIFITFSSVEKATKFGNRSSKKVRVQR